MMDDKAFVREMYDLDKSYVCHKQIYYSDGIVTSSHMHDFAEILYGVDCDYTIYADDKEYNFKSGDLMLIFPNRMHRIESLRKGESKHICVRFNPYTITDESRYVIPFILKDIRNRCYFTAEELAGCNVPDLMQEIHKECEGLRYGYEIAAKSYLQQICLFFLRCWEKNGDFNMDKAEGTRLFDVFLYIEQNYQEEICVAEMAKRYYVSSSYFSRWFKSVTGKTFKQYVNYVRINHAIQFLLSGDYTITEVAMMTGFATTSYFIKQFKLLQGGCSPKKFRRRYMENDHAERN